MENRFQSPRDEQTVPCTGVGIRLTAASAQAPAETGAARCVTRNATEFRCVIRVVLATGAVPRDAADISGWLAVNWRTTGASPAVVSPGMQIHIAIQRAARGVRKRMSYY